VDYKAVFLKEDGTANGLMKEMVDGVVGILKWINANVNNDDKFHDASIKARVQHCISEWKKKATNQKASGPPKTKYLEGLAEVDFGEFPVMIALQVCCLGEVIVKGHKNLNNLIYPVASLGAAAQLSHLKDKSERPEMLHTVIQEMEVEEYGTNAAKGLLCENAENHVGTIFDYVFYGSMLFIISKEGKNLLKHVGSIVWEEF
jgi:hypothetical protein